MEASELTLLVIEDMDTLMRLSSAERGGAGGGGVSVREEGVVSVTVRSVSSPGEVEHSDTSGGLKRGVFVSVHNLLLQIK